jgi:hypothetical protein
MVQYIGTATMSDDGTIALKLVMTGDGTPADALLTYKTDSPDYQEILHHLGGMKPDETKPVTPGPDRASSAFTKSLSGAGSNSACSC